ncbi:MAG TPA: tripartite tricarboxylate transporter substrate-binding protein, partial [Bacteroidales bacterium]|nr:tripartite tricarboxylate transporter substrate-binding protein [Bacteroidales bacterium]
RALREAGVAGYDLTAWFAAFVPVGTPAPVVDKLNAAFTAALTDPAATEEAALVMLQVIKEYYHDTGIFIGFKPAGGIREPRFAFHYLSLVYHVLGGQWLKPSLFRIGASQLLGSTRDELLSLSR